MLRIIKRLLLGLIISLLLLALIIVLVVFIPRPVPEKLQSEFQNALKANSSQIKHKDYAVIVDFEKPVFAKRLWLIDLQSNKVILNSHVSHAWKSGIIYAEDLSNVPYSNKSCAGVFVSQEAYQGSYGYSMRIHGLEKTNSNARRRAIVFHPMVRTRIGGYTFPEYVALYSFGCFATRRSIMTKIVNKMNGGRMIYVRAYSGNI